ncbi:MAG: discoidin domain-containing protein, partial [Candidatus Bipolaricaulis sp.]|nr:discoidin domain-containing protein [Candidatus Bipolaricaulis sp.]
LMRKILWTFILLGVLFIAADEMRYTPTLTSFNNGQVSPLIEARTDFDKYKSSCRRLENMFVTAQGPVTRRPGTKYICEVKDSNYPTRLIPFEYSTEDTYVIEGGSEYFRFLRDGGQILSGEGTETLILSDVVSQWFLNDNEASSTVLDNEELVNGFLSYTTETRLMETRLIHDDDGVDGCFDMKGSYLVLVADNAAYSFTDGSNDTPFSITGWFFVTDSEEPQVLVSKWYESTDQEYKLWMDEDRKLTLTLSEAVADLSGDCVSQWKLNETSGTTVTDSQGTQNGVATTDTSNLMAAGATVYTGTSFDLDNQYYVNVADNASHTFGNSTVDSAFSLAAWVYVPQYPADTIISKRDDTSGALKREYILYASLSDIYFTISDNSTGGYRRVRTNSTYFSWPPSWGWHFIVATYDGTGGTNAQNGMEIYIDGVNETNARESSGTYVAMENTAAPVLIGAHEDTSGVITGLWNKRIDNVMIFNKELSAGEVLALYNGGEGTESLTIGDTTYAKTDEAVDIGWHFIAVTYDGTGGATAADNITFFVDGNEVASTAYNNAAYTSMQNTTTGVRLGGQKSTSGLGEHYWQDKMDNIAIYNDALSAVEIASLYTQVPYEIDTPYDANEIWNLKYTQVDNEMYIVDGNHIPQRLARAGHIDWTLSDFDYSTGPFMAENKDTSITIDPPEAASDITSGVYAIASTETASYTMDEAFDNLYLVGNAWRATDKENQWIGQNFSAPKTIKRIKIYPCVNTSNLDMCMKYIKIEASADGMTYVKVPINRWLGRCESYNGDEAWVDYITTYAEYIDLYLNNDTAYRRWRVWIYDNWGDALTGVMEIEMFEEQPGVYTASSNIFNEGHIGSIWRINQERGTSILKGTAAAAAINADGTYVSNTTPWFSGGYSFVTNNSSPDFTVTLQRSTNWGATWQSALTPLNSADFDNPAETEKTGAIYRVKISDYVSGTCNYTLTITDQTNHGIIRINSYVSPTSVVATELVPLVHSDPTMTWSEGYWSNYRGWPKTVETHQERLVFGGSKSFPQTLWFGRANPDNYEDFTEGALDDDAFT